MGFGRSATDKQGIFSFDTIKPGAVPGPNGKAQAPHIVFCIFSRGMLRQVYTRLYFADEAANSADPILALVPPDRRGTLVAHKETAGDLPRLPFRHSGAGRERDRFLRDLRRRAGPFRPCARFAGRRCSRRLGNCPSFRSQKWAISIIVFDTDREYQRPDITQISICGPWCCPPTLPNFSKYVLWLTRRAADWLALPVTAVEPAKFRERAMNEANPAGNQRILPPARSG